MHFQTFQPHQQHCVKPPLSVYYTHMWDGHRSKVEISNAVDVIPKSLGHVGGEFKHKTKLGV